MTTDQSALTAAACEYDDANAYQSIPARDAAYKGFLAGAQWQAARYEWTPMTAATRPERPGYYEITKLLRKGRQELRMCSTSWWDGNRFLSAANVLAWKTLPEPWAGGQS